MRFLYFVYDLANSQGESRTLDDTYRVVLWRPGLRAFIPAGCDIFPFGVWWLFHFFRVFSNRDYCVLLVFAEATLIHRSCVFPAYFRFPFMRQKDLQIGDTYTHPEYRGFGIATMALKDAADRLATDGRVIWYVVGENNHGSIRVAEKAGFRRAAYGTRRSRFGVLLLGYYDIEQRIASIIEDKFSIPSSDCSGKAE